jgi:hypothetical protein
VHKRAKVQHVGDSTRYRPITMIDWGKGGEIARTKGFNLEDREEDRSVRPRLKSHQRRTQRCLAYHIPGIQPKQIIRGRTTKRSSQHGACGEMSGCPLGMGRASDKTRIWGQRSSRKLGASRRAAGALEVWACRAEKQSDTLIAKWEARKSDSNGID